MVRIVPNEPRMIVITKYHVGSAAPDSCACPGPVPKVPRRCSRTANPDCARRCLPVRHHGQRPRRIEIALARARQDLSILKHFESSFTHRPSRQKARRYRVTENSKCISGYGRRDKELAGSLTPGAFNMPIIEWLTSVPLPLPNRKALLCVPDTLRRKL